MTKQLLVFYVLMLRLCQSAAYGFGDFGEIGDFGVLPIWRKFINRLALAVLRTATMTMTLTLTSLINQKNHVTISTFVQVLQYLGPSTRVLKAKYWSTDGEVLEFCGVWWISPKDVIPTERSDEGSLIHQPSSINRSFAVLLSLSSSLQRSALPKPTYL